MRQCSLSAQRQIVGVQLESGHLEKICLTKRVNQNPHLRKAWMTMIMIRIQDTTSPKRGKVTIMTMMGSRIMRPMTQYRRLSYRLSNLRPQWSRDAQAESGNQ